MRSSLPSDGNNMQLSEHFELAEFLVSETAARRGIANEPTPEIIDNLRRLCQLVLEPLRVKLVRPVVITSGYRSLALNRAVGGSPTSHHRQGRAADLIVPGMSPLAFGFPVRVLVGLAGLLAGAVAMQSSMQGAVASMLDRMRMAAGGAA